jgi:hypothetical protein
MVSGPPHAHLGGMGWADREQNEGNGKSNILAATWFAAESFRDSQETRAFARIARSAQPLPALTREGRAGSKASLRTPDHFAIDASTAQRFAHDSPLEGTGFEPPVPLLRKGALGCCPPGPISWIGS